MEFRNLNRILIGLLFPAGIIVLLYFVFKPFETLQFLPAESLPYTFHTYHDSLDQSGKPTRIFKLTNTNSKIEFSYSLSDKELYPYAGVSLHSPENGYFDLSAYDYLDLSIKATRGKRIQLHISTFATGFTKKENLLSHRYLLKELDLDNSKNEYRIPITDFTTPTWWFNEHKISEKDLSSPELDKVRVFNVQNCQLLGRAIDDTITVDKISFKKNPWPFYLTSGGIVLAYIVGFLFYLNRNSKGEIDSQNKIQINYNPVSGKNQFGKELDKVIDFISANYSDPELSLRKIQLGTGVSESKVSALIREKFDLSFKQFLNQLRLNEIKRLLAETDLPIADIAYKVGYGNISHFNRVFKEMEGISPNDFRKKIKG